MFSSCRGRFRALTSGESYSIDPEGIETKVIHKMIDFSGADVLEVGSGNGRLTWRYAEDTASVPGLTRRRRRSGEPTRPPRNPSDPG